MKKTLLFFVFVLAFFCLFSVVAFADGGIDLTDVASDVSGANWYWSYKDRTLQLRSFTLTVEEGDAIRLPENSRVYYAGVCSITSTGGSGIYCEEGLLSINGGSGKLDVVGSVYGVQAQECVLFCEDITVQGRISAASGYIEADAGRVMTVSNGGEFETVPYEGHKIVRTGLLYPVYVTVNHGGGASVYTGMYAPGQTVVITARPQYGFGLKNWQSNMVKIENPLDETIRFTMPEKAVRVYGIFQRVYTLTIPEVEGGHVDRITVGTAHPAGKQVILYAVPDHGYYFSHWTSDYGRFRDPLQSYAAITMPSVNATVTPVFVKGESYYLKVEKIGEGETNITIGNFAENKSILLRATPAEGYVFSGWMSESGRFLSSSEMQTYFTMPGENVVVTAVFSLLDEYKKTLTVAPLVGGTVNVTGGLYAPGMPITLKAEPKTGYEFLGWTIEPSKYKDAFLDGNFAETDFLMPSEDVTISARFALLDPQAVTFYLSVGESAGGTVISDGSGEYLAGYEITLSATPEEGYYFAGWKSAVGGKFENAMDPNTIFYMPANDTKITAKFSKIIDPNASLSGDTPPPIDGADLESGFGGEYLSFGLSLVLCGSIAAGGTVYADVARKAWGIPPLRLFRRRRKYDRRKMKPVRRIEFKKK
ncbi:MAG: InlB B-repeat-containing protein [Clostridia bacterium]|nr:InlB B-repeat-containing protein [Clostridia bacterium]